MFMDSVIEDSFNIAWGFLEKSGCIRDAEASTSFLVQYIEGQIRAGERRPLVIANRAIDVYRSDIPQPAPLERGHFLRIP